MHETGKVNDFGLLCYQQIERDRLREQTERQSKELKDSQSTVDSQKKQIKQLTDSVSLFHLSL